MLTYPVMRAMMRTLMAVVLAGCIDVRGRENIPRQGGLLVVGNHIATLDPPLTGSLIPRLDVYYMAKSEQFESRVSRWVLRGFNAYPVVRRSADRTALRHTLALLGRGHVVLVYPEGQRSWDGTLRRPQPGAGFLIRHAGVPVLPAAIWGSEHILPQGSRWPRRAPVHIRFGAPLTPAELGGSSNQEVADAAMRAVAALLPAHHRGFAGP